LGVTSTATRATQQDRIILHTATLQNGNSSTITWRLFELFGNSGSIPAHVETQCPAKTRERRAKSRFRSSVVQRPDWLARVAGFEPRDGRFRGRQFM